MQEKIIKYLSKKIDNFRSDGKRFTCPDCKGKTLSCTFIKNTNSITCALCDFEGDIYNTCNRKYKNGDLELYYDEETKSYIEIDKTKLDTYLTTAVQTAITSIK